MSQSVSGSMQRLWQASVSDRQLTQSEYNQLKAQYLQENPELQESDAQAAIENLFAQSQSVDQHAASTLLSQVRQGESIPVVSLFGEDESLRVGVEVQGAEIEDIDGITVHSRDDLRGKIDSLNVELPLPSGTLDSLNQQYQRLMPHLQNHVDQRVREWFQDWSGPDFNDNWADGVRDTENPDSWWNTVHSGLKLLEHGAEGVLNAGAKVSEWGADVTGIDDLSASQISGFTRDFAAGLKFERTQRDGQNILRFAGEAGNVPGWLKPVVPDKYEQLFENPHILDVIPNPEGNLTLDLFPGNPAMREMALAELTSSSGNTEELAGSMANTALDNVKSMLAEYGVEAELSQNAQGQFEFKPTALHLKGEQLAQVLGPENAALIQSGELSLKPEQFRLNWTDQGLNVELRNVDLTGSSDINGDTAEANDWLSRVAVDQGRGEVEIGADGEIDNLSLHDLVARVSGQNTLSDEVIDVVKTKVVEALDSLNEKLQRYGLSREQLSALMSQIPTQLFQNLLSSANQGDVAAVAQSFGISGEDLTNALNFLREQPLEQVIQDLKAVSEMVDVNTTLTGETTLTLDSLNLSRNDQQMLAQLSNLQIQTQAEVETTTGLRSDLNLTGRFDSIEVNSQRNAESPETVTTDVRLGDSEISAQASHSAGNTTPLQRGQNFIQDLRQGQNFVVESGNRQGYLKDEGPNKIRQRAGLRLETALAEYEKAPIEDWIQAAGDPNRQNAFFERNQIRYGRYLMQYLEQNVINAPATEQGTEVTASMRTSGSNWSTTPGNTEIRNPLIQARVRREHDGSTSDIDAAIQANRFATQGDGSAILTGGRAALGGSIEEANGTTTEFHSEISTERISSQNDAQGQAQLHASQVGLGARVVSQGNHSPVEGRFQLNFEEATANSDEIRGRGGHIPQNGVRIQAEQTEATLSADYVEIAAREEGLTADTRVNWQVRGSNRQAGSSAAVNATTTAAIRDGELTHTSTDNMYGTVGASRRTVHDMLRARPELRAFANYLERHEVLKPGQTHVVLQNNAPIVTGPDGEVQSYDITVEAPMLSTNFGNGELSFRAKSDGSVSGHIELNPNRVLENTLRDSLNQLLQEKLREKGRRPDSLGILDVKVENGKLSLSMNESRLENLDVSLDPRGNELIVSVDQARIDGFVQRLFAGLLGVDPRAEAAGAIRDAMSALGAKPTGSRYEISVPTDRLLGQALGEDLAGDVRITPEIQGSQLQLDFLYPGKRQ